MPEWEETIERYFIDGWLQEKKRWIKVMTDEEMLNYKEPEHPTLDSCKYYSVTVTLNPRNKHKTKKGWIGNLTNIEIYEHFKQVLKTLRRRGYFGTFYPEYHGKGERVGYLHFHGLIYTMNEDDTHEKSAIQTALTRRCGMIKMLPIISEKQLEGWKKYIEKDYQSMKSKFSALSV